MIQQSFSIYGHIVYALKTVIELTNQRAGKAIDHRILGIGLELACNGG